jgi:ligand-binding sensor domain-containing protein
MIKANKALILFLLILFIISLSCKNKNSEFLHDLNFTSKTFTSKSVFVQSITEFENFIWIGTREKGLIRLNTKTKELEYFTPFNSEIKSLNIKKLTVDNNKLWILGDSNSISTYSNNKISNLNIDKLNLGTKQIVDINFDNDSNVFFSINDKDDVLNPEKIARYIPGKNLIKEIIDSKAIAFDKNKTIWTLASPSWLEGGLEKYERKENYFLKEKKTFHLDSCERKYGMLTKLIIDKKNRKWISTSSKSFMSYVDTTLSGLMVFNESKYYIFKQKDTKLSKDGIEDMVFDNNGNLWIIESGFSNNRTVRYDGKNWTFFDSKEINLPNSKRITTIFSSENNGIWIGSQDGGITQYHNDKWVSYDLGNSEIPSNNICSINSDNERVWIGAEKGIAEGTVLKGQVNFKEIETGYKFLNKIRPNTIFRDSNNKIWIGLLNNKFSPTIKAGVMEYNGKNWIYHFKNPEINSIIQTKDKSIYMGGHDAFMDNINALYRFSENSTSLDTINLNINEKYNINSMASDSKGNIWISLKLYKSNKSYIYVYDGNNIKKKYNCINSELKANQVNSIYIDDEDTKWFATDDGLISYKQEWKKYTTKNSNITSNKINCIVMDIQKNIWIGTDNGISMLKKGNFTNFNTKNTNLLSNKITSIHIDKHNNKWIGTWGGGVTKLTENK